MSWLFKSALALGLSAAVGVAGLGAVVTYDSAHPPAQYRAPVSELEKLIQQRLAIGHAVPGFETKSFEVEPAAPQLKFAIKFEYRGMRRGMHTGNMLVRLALTEDGTLAPEHLEFGSTNGETSTSRLIGAPKTENLFERFKESAGALVPKVLASIHYADLVPAMPKDALVNRVFVEETADDWFVVFEYRDPFRESLRTKWTWFLTMFGAFLPA